MVDLCKEIGEFMAKGKWLEEQAYEFILNKIENREWLPQEHIRELEVAKKLDISRTPVRKAFKRLEEENILEIVPYKGAVILNPRIDSSSFQNRTEFLELYLIHYFHKLERNEIEFSTEKLEEKIIELKEAMNYRDKSFEEKELEFWQLLLEYSSNKYSKAQILETIRTSIPDKGKIRARILSSRKSKVEHFEKLIELLSEDNYPFVRREVRILLNQLNLNVIQGV